MGHQVRYDGLGGHIGEAEASACAPEEIAWRAPEQRLSVVMPVYNAERFLGEAVASILGQSYADFEFVVVDDGSTDGSLGAIRPFRIRESGSSRMTPTGGWSMP